MSYFDRCQKQMSQQQQAMSHLVKRVNNLIERREKKEKAFVVKGSSIGRDVDVKPMMPIKAPLQKPKPQQIEKGDESSDDSDNVAKLRRQKEAEMRKIENMYLNDPEEKESEHLEKLTKIAGKYKKDADFGMIRSKMLDYQVNALQSIESGSEEGSHSEGSI